jgi:hypothetical protein
MKKAQKKAEPVYRMEMIDSAKLEVLRDDYQKQLNKKRVAQIVTDFDERIANEPKVSYRDGHYYVFDGQHSVSSRILLNGGHLPILCKVYRGLTEEDEALLFAEQTGHASMPTPADKLRARLFANEKEAVAFKQATESAGFILDLDGSNSDYHIRCINTALRMYRRVQPECYKEALGIIALSWNGARDSLLNEVIIAVSEFAYKYRGRYNSRILIDLLSKTNPREISQRIQADFKHPGYKKYLYPIYQLYNDNCGGAKLPLEF